MKNKVVGIYVGRFLIVLFTLITAVLINLLAMVYMFTKGPSKSARDLFTTTMLETGQMKFVASIFLSQEEIMEAVAENSMEAMDEEMNTDMIQITTVNEEKAQDSKTAQEPIVIEEISGRTFFAKMLIVQDPSKVSIGTTYPWGTYGKELGTIVEEQGAIAGVNGGLYQSTGNSGGLPMGIVVSNGEIQYNACSGIRGLYLIGFNEDDILLIKNIGDMSNAQVENLVKEEKVRDAIVFQEESSDANNHFVPFLINGEARHVDGMGSGANPRTAIGQRADGTVLLLVTDGRGVSGHLGATASDLIQIMQEYGAVNAANIDGGSSSSMYYDGDYEMTSVTFYFSNSSWKLPTAFVVKE